MIKLYKMNISGIDLEDKSVYEKLSPKRIEKVRALKKDTAKCQSIGGELLLFEALKDRYPDAKTPALWNTDRYGKLYFCDYPDLFVNLSHSGEYAVCAASDRPVGADIQYMREVNLSLAKRFFTEEENDLIKKSENKKNVFFGLWVRKESFIKAVGKGLAISLKSFCAIDDEIQYEGERYKFYDSEFDDYKICVCVKL